MAIFQPAWITAAQAAEGATAPPIPASVTLAQFALESSWGQRIPAGSNNGFGIKAVAGQPRVLVATHEFIAGRYVAMTAAFAAYPSLTAGFTAHSELLATHAQYAEARTYLPDPYAFADAMAQVYATDPLYYQKLWDIMDAHDLTQYDKAAT